MADKEHKKVIIKKVKKGGHGGHHGGSWKVAYADFVTAMMAFFLVMWLVNSLPKEKRQEIAQYFQSFSLLDTGGRPNLIPGVDLSQVQQENNPPAVVQPISESPAGAAKEKSEAEKLAEAVEEAIRTKTPDLKEQVIVKTEADKVIVELTEDAKGKPLFALGKSDLTPDAKRVLAAAAPKLAQSGKGKLSIEGHTDAVGVVAGYAATRPFVPDNVYDPRNRRIRLVMEVPKPAQPDKPKQEQGAPAKGTDNIFAQPQQQAPAPPQSPIPQEKREILDLQIERLYDQHMKAKP